MFKYLFSRIVDFRRFWVSVDVIGMGIYKWEFLGNY